jgi:hypothetical protein
MASKITTIRLRAGEMEREFEVAHAERLLRMPNNGGWHIADDEKVELTENGFKPRKNK